VFFLTPNCSLPIRQPNSELSAPGNVASGVLVVTPCFKNCFYLVVQSGGGWISAAGSAPRPFAG